MQAVTFGKHRNRHAACEHAEGKDEDGDPALRQGTFLRRITLFLLLARVARPPICQMHDELAERFGLPKFAHLLDGHAGIFSELASIDENFQYHIKSSIRLMAGTRLAGTRPAETTISLPSPGKN